MNSHFSLAKNKNMNTQLFLLISLLLVGGMLVYYFVIWTVQRDFRDHERLVDDAPFRAQKIAELNTAIITQPHSAKLWHRRARLHYYDNNFPAAVADAIQYSALKPDDSEGWAEQADYALLAGQKNVATNAITNALKINSANADYQAIEQKING